MAKKNLYEDEEYHFHRPTNRQLLDENRDAYDRGVRDAYGGRFATKIPDYSELLANDALEQAKYQQWANDNPYASPKQPGSGNGGNGGGDGVDWSLYPNGRAGEVLQFGDMPAGGFSYGKAPEYIDPYKRQIDALTQQILGRGPFSYDYNTDPLYQQYAASYGDAGRRAMQDTLAQVSARTGGLASSYAGSASQQAYNNYMARLADKVPELRQAAYAMYQDEGNQMRQNLAMLEGLSDTDYGRYGDRLSQWNTDRAFNYGAAEDEYNRNLALAQLAAGYGDLSGIEGLGVDLTAYRAKQAAGSGSGGGRASASQDASGEKPSLSEAAVRSNITKGNFSPEVLAAYEYHNGIPYTDTITDYDEASRLLKGMGITERPITKRTWEAHKSGRPDSGARPNDYSDAINYYDSYEDYLREYLEAAVEVKYGI